VSKFLDALERGPLLFDGAMGSLLYERGVFLNRSYDELNLSQPEMIRAVHRDYLDAGAQVIETNTFGANRLALAKHNHASKAEAINRAGARLAREVAGDQARVSGAIGPTGVQFGVATEAERKGATEALAEQIRVLVEEQVDLLCFETFVSILELEAALQVRSEIAPDTPALAMLVFTPEGVAEGGLNPEQVADRLVEAGADVIGANCGMGPPELYRIATAMVGRGAPVAIMPNAGLPSMIEGRTIYVANP
jgi:homocysteine S-methyltransferase